MRSFRTLWVLFVLFCFVVNCCKVFKGQKKSVGREKPVKPLELAWHIGSVFHQVCPRNPHPSPRELSPAFQMQVQGPGSQQSWIEALTLGVRMGGGVSFAIGGAGKGRVRAQRTRRSVGEAGGTDLIPRPPDTVIGTQKPPALWISGSGYCRSRGQGVQAES